MINTTNQRLLVIAPHPDDEVLGCGGLIKYIKSRGGSVFVLYLTVGNTNDYSQKGKSTVNERKKEMEKVINYLKIDRFDIVFAGNKYHLKLDTIGQKDIIQYIEKESLVSISKVKPTMIAFPSVYSYNQDHQITAKAAHAALRPAETTKKHFISCAFAYEVPADSWTLNQQVKPNILLPLSKADMEAKLKALSLYASQVRQSPNPRSLDIVKALAKLRGSMCVSSFAEGFIAYRIMTH